MALSPLLLSSLPSGQQILCIGTIGHAHRNYAVESALTLVQADATYDIPVRNGLCSPAHCQYQSLQVQRRAPNNLAFNIGHARQHFFGSQKYFHSSKGFPGSRTVSSNVAILEVLDAQDPEREREEARWLREEKRWLREEERWLREEARWNIEHESLVQQSAALSNEIEVLKHEIAQLQNQLKDEKLKDGAISDLIISLTTLLQSLNRANALGTDSRVSTIQGQIASATSSASIFLDGLSDVSSKIPVRIPENVSTVHTTLMESTEVSSTEMRESTSNDSSTTSRNSAKKRRTLKKGAEGDDVKMMQEALAKLGFYSGEDDMEYSVFSSGTDRAVRSWQAMIGTSEDGIATTELLIKLFGEETQNISKREKEASVSASSSHPKAGTGGAVKSPLGVTLQGPASSDVKTQGSTSSGVKTQVSVSPGSTAPLQKSETLESTYNSTEPFQNRVYLLGENRWEEPSRLLSKNGPSPAVVVGEKCFSCKGQGNTMCTECEGTGELNVEEQFLEWAEEGAKCPYCEGAGVINCDVCDGKGLRTP